MANFNMQPKKHPMPVQDPEARKNNFEEVALGYDEKTAMEEARRCLNCRNKPCVNGCPVGIAIPEFISHVAAGEFEAAYEVISRSSALPAVCGRVCPQETQCEGKCTRGIKAGCEAVGIGYLERFVADYHNSRAATTQAAQKAEKSGKKVAVIGSGPAGLTCAGDLAKAGYDVTVFEALHVAGGVLVYGIPQFRLPKEIVRREVENLKALGVTVLTDMVIGKVLSIEELKSEYGFEAVFIGSGAGLPKFMNIEGEGLNGVYSANEFLTRINLMKAAEPGSTTPVQHMKTAIVVGGGNVAMDAARCARRLGAEVHIVYRRGEEELPARKEEVQHAKEEGVIFDTLTNPVRILATETENPRDKDYAWVRGVECVRMRLGEPDESGRRSPIAVPGSEFVINADCVIMSLGTSPNPLLKNTTAGLTTLKRGEIAVDENGKTSIEGVYCGGDAATGAATVIKAMGAGKIAAKAIDEYLKSKR
ncbi:MAG: NADPH-dependent glutamate synthase [Candidatus Scatosoma sp.]